MRIDIEVAMPMGDNATVLGYGSSALAKLVTSKQKALAALEMIDFN